MNKTVYESLLEDGISSVVTKGAEGVKDFLFESDYENKILVRNFYVPLSIVTLYVLLVKWVGPFFMKDRKPYNFKKSMILYNFVNASLNLYIAYSLGTFAWKNWNKRCSVTTNPELKAHLMLIERIIWHWILMKYFDLCDTLFFVLRKKNNQITYLHVFHHVGMCIIGVTIAKLGDYGFYLLVGMSINCLVHVVMYTYYGLAAFGPHMQKYLWWKKYITLIQMGQFLFVLIYMLEGFITGCEKMGRTELTLFCFVVTVLLLFMNFYIKTYKHHKKSQKTL